MAVTEFETILYQNKVKGQHINEGQLDKLRRMWPMVLTEIKEQGVEDYKDQLWWEQFKRWLR